MNETRSFTLNRAASIGLFFVVFGGLLFLALAAPHAGLLDLRFNPFALLSGTTLVLNLGLLIYFTSRPARTEERIWLTFYLAALVAYALGETLMRLSATPQAATFWDNVSNPGAGVGVALYLFSLAYTNRSERRYPGTAALLLLGTLFMVFFLSFTNLIWPLASSAMKLQAWGYDLSYAGPGIWLDLLWYGGLLALALARFISFRRHTRNEILRKQSLIFIYATAIPFIGGIIFDGALPTIGIDLPAMGVTLATLGAFLLIYGVIKYQLLTISPTLFSNTILAIMQESVVVTDTKFNIVFINQKAEALLGTSANSQDQVSLLSLITAGTLPTFQDAFANVTNGSQAITIGHIDINGPHDNPVPVHVTSSRLEISGYETRVMILNDITDELRTHSIIEHEVKIRTEELNQARAYLVSSINSLEQGFILVDRHSKVELANHVVSRLCQVTDSEITGKHLAELVKPILWDANLGDLVHKVLDSKHHRYASAEATDGSFYEIFVTPVLSGERELGATIVIQNVTEQKILDRSKDEFFSIASHELRTPLTAIRGNMSMFRDYSPDVMKDATNAAMINDTHEASIRLIEIVNDFLDSSQLEQGRMQFKPQPVAVKDIIDIVITDLGELSGKQHRSISLIDLGKAPKVLADSLRLRQIFYHLIKNALMYGEHATVAVTTHADSKNLYVRFTDTGKGISPENQKLLFHKFQQASSSILTRDNTKGTGLGLYISRLLAKNMHGDIELERSEMGKGSTFVVRLPLARGH